MNEELEQYVPRVHFEKIPIKNLVSNQNYQRNISMRHVRKAAADFDPYQINPVKVSRRGNINYVFNGQHTIEIVAAVSGSRETPVWCMIYDDLEYKEEADIFANQQKYVKELSPYEIFKANLEADNTEQVMINDLVNSYNLEIASTRRPGCICAIRTLEEIYEKSGYDVLDRVLRLIIGTWEGDPLSFGSGLLKGLWKLIDAYGSALKDEVFVEKLGRLPVRSIIREATELRRGTMGFAEVLLDHYNKKMKPGLSYEVLYTSQRNRSRKTDDDSGKKEHTETEVRQESLFEGNV